MSESIRDTYGLLKANCKFQSAPAMETPEYRARREAHNGRMTQLNSANHSLRAGIDLYAFASQCLNQLAKKLEPHDEGLTAFPEPVIYIPNDAVRLKSAWKIDIEEIDGTGKSWQIEMKWVSERLRDVKAKRVSICSAVAETASTLILSIPEKELYRQDNMEHPVFGIVYDGSNGHDSLYDDFWGFRCSDVVPKLGCPTREKKMPRAQFITLYELPATAVEAIYRYHGDKNPGRVVVVSKAALDRLGVQMGRHKELSITYEPDQVKKDRESSLWYVKRWLPRQAILGTFGFAEFIKHCDSAKLKNAEGGRHDLTDGKLVATLDYRC